MTGERTSPTLRDAWLPALLATLSTLETVAQDLPGRPAAVALTVLSCALLVWRRPHAALVAPLAVVVLLTTPFLGPQLNDGAVPIGILALATYSLGRYAALRPGLRGLAICYTSFAVVWFVEDRRPHRAVDVVFLAFFLVPPYVLGRVVARIDAQHRRLVEQRDLVEDLALHRERVRIARELHDVLAHSLSAMVVQTDAARDLAQIDPRSSGERLDGVAATGRRALGETDHLLGDLGVPPVPGVAAPAPGLRGLDDLVVDFTARGLDVDLVIAPGVGPVLAGLPPGLDLTAYRVLQEALNNAWRHGSGVALVRVESLPDALRLTVENPLGGARPVAPGSGLGLTGVRERVALYGGVVSSEVTRDRRHVLRVDLPLGPGSVAPAVPDPVGAPATAKNLRPTRADVWPAALVAAVCVADLATSAAPGGRGIALVLVLLASGLLVWRRVAAPVVAPAAMAVLLTGSTVAPMLDTGTSVAFLLLAAYALGRHPRPVPGLGGLVLVVALFLFSWVAAGGGPEHWTDVTYLLLLLTPPYVLGRVVRTMASQAEQLLEQQRVLEEQAAGRERLRVARELHDVLVHSLGAMVVQVAAARDLLSSDPAAAAAGLDAVAAAGRAALGETGRLLHVLRDEEDELGLAPAGALRVPAPAESLRGTP
jgi:signal transduction histidine kinase